MHPLEGGPTEPPREGVRVGRVQQQPHFAYLCGAPPASDGALPPEIPDTHPGFTETPDIMGVESTFGPPIDDRIGVQKDPSRGQEVIIATHLAGRYLYAPEVVPLTSAALL